MSKSPYAGERASPALTTPYLPNPSHHKKTQSREDGSPCCSAGCQGPFPCNPLRWRLHRTPTSLDSTTRRGHGSQSIATGPVPGIGASPSASPLPAPTRALFSFIFKVQPSPCHRWAGEWGKGALYNRSVAICQLGQAACSRLHRIKYLITDYTPMGHD